MNIGYGWLLGVHIAPRVYRCRKLILHNKPNAIQRDMCYSSLMSIVVRSARNSDTQQMSRLLNRLVALGGSTAHLLPFDEDRIRTTFVESKFSICCFVAIEEETMVGFQALEWADPNWSGPDPLSADWAIIATYVASNRHGKGIGRKLFASTRFTAKAANVKRIDATIRRENLGGQAYYQSIGFTDYRQGTETVSKQFQFS